MNLKILTNSFESAQENMQFDQQLVTNNQPLTSIVIRIYTWQIPSITQAYNKAIPSDLKHINHSSRISGGGLVFHTPGDILVTTLLPLKSKPKQLSTLLKLFKTSLEKTLSPHIHLTPPPQKKSSQNIAICQNYHSPYELYKHNKKYAAIAARRFANILFIQSIIHCGNQTDIFHTLPPTYKKHTSTNLPLPTTSILKQLPLHFKDLYTPQLI